MSQADYRLVTRAAKLCESGDCNEALSILRRGDQTSEAIHNAIGVCLMRLGHSDKAISKLRSMVVRPDCSWIRKDIPVLYRANFISALLVAGNVAGVRSALAEISEKSHPSIVRLQQALTNYVKSLSWWNRMNYFFGLIDDVVIPINFTPGEFVDPLAPTGQVMPIGSSATAEPTSSNPIATPQAL